jgi:hypothetical protein
MKKIIVTVIVVILVAAAGAVWYYKDHEKKIVPTPQITQNPITPPKPQYATVGQVVDNFPKNLLIGTAATPKSSYTIAYPNSSQSTTTYETSDSMDGVYGQYLSYFQINKYVVLNKTQSAKIDTISAVNPTGSASNGISVTVIPDGSQSKVTTSYTK